MDWTVRARAAGLLAFASALGLAAGIALADPSADVTIKGFAFAPDTLTIAHGATVTWTNKDNPLHAVAFDDGSPGVPLLKPGESFSRTFDHAGSFDYHCSIHPDMTAKIVVK